MWIKFTLAICLLALSERYVYAQFPYVGKCPEPNVTENFDIQRFYGKWYEIERTMSVLEVGSQCVSTNFSSAGQGYGEGSVEIIHEGLGPVLKLKRSTRLIAKVPDMNEPAKMTLRLSDLSLKTRYWVLDTDYDNYALVWGCNDIWLALKYARAENLWVISRNRTLSEENLQKIHDRLEDEKLKSRKLLLSVNQENCPDDV